jgi:hypothetical protein
VIVHDDNRRGRRDDGQPENLSWVNKERVHCPDGHKLVSFDTAASI